MSDGNRHHEAKALQMGAANDLNRLRDRVAEAKGAVSSREARLIEALQYIVKQWPDSSAAKHARAALIAQAKP